MECSCFGWVTPNILILLICNMILFYCFIWFIFLYLKPKKVLLKYIMLFWRRLNFKMTLMQLTGSQTVIMHVFVLKPICYKIIGSFLIFIHYSSPRKLFALEWLLIGLVRWKPHSNRQSFLEVIGVWNQANLPGQEIQLANSLLGVLRPTSCSSTF